VARTVSISLKIFIISCFFFSPGRRGVSLLAPMPMPAGPETTILGC
jgi:hypothetical protein